MSRLRGLFSRRSLAVRLLVIAISAATIPTLVISWLHRSISSRALAESIERQQTEIAHRIADGVNDEIRSVRLLVGLVAQGSSFAAGSRIDQYEALRNLLEARPSIQEAMFVAPGGQELLKVTRQSGPARLGRRLEATNVPFIGAPFFAGNRLPTVLVGHPVKSYANPSRSGAIMAKLSFNSLGSLLRGAQIGANGMAFIVNDRGTLLAHPDEQLVLSHANWADRPVVKAWLADPEKPSVLTESWEGGDDPLESVAYPIPLLKSAVVVQQPKSQVHRPIEDMVSQLIIWTLVSLVIFVSLSVWLAGRIVAPIQQLRGAAERIGAGERDIRLRIQTQDELQDLGEAFEQMAASLAQLERLRNDLTHMIVHDLKMPLSTMMASLDSLLLGDFGRLEKGQTQFVQIARRSGQEMLLLIQNLLDVAKLEEGKLILHRERFAPRGWAENVLFGFQPLADAAQKKIRLHVAPDVGPVLGDIGLLSRVLANLVSNALRHTARVTGEVDVSLYADGPYLAVQVRDNGEGIPHADQRHVFEKFVQADRAGGEAGRSPRTGVGLGLTFCKMVVEAHEGRISLYSQAGEGTLFTLHLPMQPPVSASSVAALPSDKVGFSPSSLSPQHHNA